MKKFLKRVKRFVLKNKLLTILIALILLIMISGIIVIKVWLFPHSRGTKYGNRLDGIENVKLTDSRLDEVKSSFEAKSGFSITGFRVSGKIVNIYVTAGEISKSDVKAEAAKFIKKFSEDEIKFYDFQFFVTGSSEEYPILGYKNKNSEGLLWNNEGGN